MIHRTFPGKWITLAFLAVACCLLPGAAAPVAAKDYVVVVNKSLGLDTISSSDLEAIFTGKQKFWASGEKVVLAVYANDEVQQSFFRQHVNKTPSQFKNYWTKMVFTGKANMPPYYNTPAEVLSFVSGTPGAISFVPAPAGDKVKTLNIN